ncbi:Phosphomevalonate kinase [Trametes versicolor FP-101664 SS1]|uniref:Phosphomevalonate kinase n=1 Tax=Trametes versicolor (strain FP-101664) TaxID=717944 RepID=UPI0004623CE4|nr:Phosphomevalonate kinase [Trametes versicolor FP-101664 SS1]EIW63108.1 Phosphomevalonate kinase [Trametes versicolor FP-101664 SS1]
MSSPTVISSPGKVLLAGGYLVLDPAYSGVVVSTSSRFYTTIETLPQPHRVEGPIQIRVRSPQFVNASWLYFVDFAGPDGVRVEHIADSVNGASSQNKFVHLALQRTLTLAAELKSVGTLQNTLSYGLDITIVGDNDFYSQRAQLTARNLPPTLQSLSKLPPFNKTGVHIADVHKTGLGSSAALITSLVSGLLLHLSVIPADSFATEGGTASASEGRKLAHNLAQYVHCLAQGKVGSGFDVSAAVFGSQLYTRFDPAVIEPLMSENLASQALHPVIAPSNPAWNYRVEPFKLPPQTRLMLADVDAGSDTPSLVGKVLKWRKANAADAKTLWDTIDSLNQGLSRALLGLSAIAEKNPTAYRKAVKYISTIQSVQWLANPNIAVNSDHSDLKEVIEGFIEAHNLSEGIRANMRAMGQHADVPIEPPEQTALLDACISVAGVVGGGVPGAGGYDAIWLLVLDPVNCPPEELPSTRVERVWSTYTGLDVSPLLANESIAMGVRVEALDSVPGLRDIVRES